MKNIKDFIFESLNKQPKLLYRAESSSHPERDAISVMMFEIEELENEDIFDYVLDNYKLSDELKESIETYMDSSEGNLENILKNMLSEIKTQTGKDIKYALWLAEKETVIDMYDGKENGIDVYETKDGVILSDLGYDGVLFGFEKLPEPIDYIEPED
jgi:hypothetical protein